VANALRTVDEETVSVLWPHSSRTPRIGSVRTAASMRWSWMRPIDGASCLVVPEQLRRLALPPAASFWFPTGIAPTLEFPHTPAAITSGAYDRSPEICPSS
jgi:hypothetical protein